MSDLRISSFTSNYESPYRQYLPIDFKIEKGLKLLIFSFILFYFVLKVF